MSTDIRHDYATVNGVKLHYATAGEGKLVVLLHGFPEFWYGWHRQIPALAAAGYKVVAPDMRGYNLSEKPEGVEAYRMQHLTADVRALSEHFGEERALLVGHDWGGVVAWGVALRYPERLEKLVILNAPHPAAYRREAKKLSQLMKSWYVFAFQLPFVPERFMRLGGKELLGRTFRSMTIRPDVFSDEDIERYAEALFRPGALTAAINYYRAFVRRSARAMTEPQPIELPTLLIWGEEDKALNSELSERLEPFVPNITVERLPGVGHFVQHEAADRVNVLLLDFLGR